MRVKKDQGCPLTSAAFVAHMYRFTNACMYIIYTHTSYTIPHIHIYIFIGLNLVTSRIMEDFDLYIF